MELANLYFGKDDAETDMGIDGLLRAGFLPTPAFRSVRRARKRLIIGRKGSGKSAICRTLASEDPATILVTPDALSMEALRDFSLDGIPTALAKELIWRYVLAVRVAERLVRHAADHQGKAPKSIGRLRTFLVDNGELDATTSAFWQAVERLRGSLKLEAFGVGATVGVGGPSPGVATSGQLDVLERHVGTAIADLACPAEHGGPLLLIDQIEDVWTNDGDADALVIGVLRASRKIPGLFPGVRCVVFLRADIWEALHFPDKDKLHGDELRMDWTADRLLDLVTARARASLGTELDQATLFSAVFPAGSAELLVGHTLMRPRDIIHLCNLCRDLAEERDHDRIHWEDVQAAIEIYSDWKLEDLPNEYLSVYPYLRGLLTPAFRDGGYLVTRRALEIRLRPILEVLRREFPRRAIELTVEDVLEALYEIGFLGVRRNGVVRFATGRGDGLEAGDTEFHVHPCFRSALRCTTAIASVATANWMSSPALDRQVQELGQTQRGRDSRVVPVIWSAALRLQEATQELGQAGLPQEVLEEVTALLSESRQRVLAVQYTLPADAIDVLRERWAFLTTLGRRLAQDAYDGHSGQTSAAGIVLTATDRLQECIEQLEDGGYRERGYFQV